MAVISSKHICYTLVLVCVLLVLQIESKRSGGRRKNSGSRTTPRSHNSHTTSYHHTTPRYYQQDIGFENVQHRVPPQNNQPTQPIGFNIPKGGNANQPAGDTFHKTNLNQVGNSNPSAPIAQPPSSPIGFENVQNRIPPQNNQNIGVNSNTGNYHTQSGILVGHPQGYQPNTGGYHPQGYQPNGFNIPPSGGYHPGQYNSGGFYNSQSYYNPHFGTPNGIPPHIYQPVQQSSGSSWLGYAGSFAGGYLIGRLASGGHDSGNHQYTVHHYHHNRDQVPKQINVTDKSLIACSQNETQGLCVPNTFPICLANGTIMCVTHTPYTVPCGANSTSACVITALPCPVGDSACSNGTANFTTTVVYVPCISNVTVARKIVTTDNSTTINKNSNPILNSTKVELCVTAIAEPKKTESPVGSFMNVIAQLGMLPIELMQNTTTNPVNTSTDNTSYTVANRDTTNATDIPTVAPLPT